MGTYQWGIRRSVELESQMTSVERLLEYSELPSEPALESDNKNAPPKDWPKYGHIEFKSLHFRYAENSARILRNLTFQIDAKVHNDLNHFTQYFHKHLIPFFSSKKLA